MRPRILSLFSGYGGLDLALHDVLGAETAYVADIEPGPRKVLAHRFPNAPNLGDVTKIDWAALRGQVDIIAGGSPCQDLSHAGKRAGMTDGTRSNLWVQMREAIATIRPGLVVWENVRGALSATADSDLEWCPGCMGDPGHGGPALRALGRVVGDLAELGYDARWVGLRAADVGACHGRYRVFLVAYPAGHPWRLGDRDGAGAADADGVRWRAVLGGVRPRKPDARRGPAADTDSLGRDGGGRAWGGRPESADGDRGPVRLLLKGIARYERFGEYTPAIARQVATFGLPAPEPTEPGKNGPRLSARFAEWMMGLPAGWVTGVPGMTRSEALRLLGNGVVPQQAGAALRWLLA